jgi:hypothetical protein
MRLHLILYIKKLDYVAMKLDRLETHDRLLSFKKNQVDIIRQGIDDCLKRNPLSLAYQERSPYIYIFAHPRTADDGVTKRMLWQPRLGKPKAQTNSYLFRAKSYSDILEICWLLPPRELWGQYEKGKITESDYVLWSINQFKSNREELEKPFADDFTNEQIKQILKEIAKEMDEDKKSMQVSSVAS